MRHSQAFGVISGHGKLTWRSVPLYEERARLALEETGTQHPRLSLGISAPRLSRYTSQPNDPGDSMIMRPRDIRRFQAAAVLNDGEREWQSSSVTCRKA
jgi:hypothetical protein